MVFELVPANAEKPVENGEKPVEEIEFNVDLNGLRARALEAARSTPQIAGTAARRSLYRRAAAARRYVLARAAGICESCN